MMSLKRSLILALSGLFTLVGLLAALYSYFNVNREASDLLDLQQQQVARFVGDGRAVVQANIGLPPHDMDEDYVIRIDYTDGRPSIQSNTTMAFPAGLKAGFEEFSAGDRAWRVYSLIEGAQTVRVAQRTSELNEMAEQAAFNTAAPIFLMMPVIWALIYWLIGMLFRPIDRIAADLKKRSPDDTSEISTTGARLEFLPLLIATNHAFSRMAETLVQQRAFLADAAHELRSPLAALSLQVENLKNAQSEVAFEERAAAVKAGVERLGALVAQLLLLARQEANPEAAVQEHVHLADIVLATVGDLYPLIDAKGLDIGIDADRDIIAWGSEKALKVLVETILHNAVHYCDVAGRIDISVSRQNGLALVSVVDTGPGIDEADLERVFDRFYRASADRQGSGLGLAIARTITEKLNGTISLSNRSDARGLYVEILLPSLSETYL